MKGGGGGWVYGKRKERREKTRTGGVRVGKEEKGE